MSGRARRGPTGPALPWPLFLAALTALAAFRLGRDPSPGVSVAVGLLLLAQAVPPRLRQGRLSFNPWPLAFVASAVEWIVPIATGVPAASLPIFPVAPAQLSAVAIVALAWRTEPWDDMDSVMGAFLSGIVLLASLNHKDPVRSLAVVLVFTLFLLATGAQRAHSPGAPRRSPLPISLMALQAAAIAATILVGACSTLFVNSNRDGIARLWSDLGKMLARPQHAAPTPRTSGSTAAGDGTPAGVPSSEIAQPHLGDGPGELPGEPTAVLELRGPVEHELLRGRAYETYDWGRWILDWDAPISCRRRLAAFSARGADPAERVSVTPVAPGYVLYVPLGCRGVDGGGDRVTIVFPDRGIVVEQAARPYSYLPAHDAAGQGPCCSKPTRAEQARLTRVPASIDRRVARLARRITAGCRTPLERVAAIRKYLAGHYGYSLRYKVGDGDPLSGFILGNRPAHCAYFGGAAVILMRCVGVPARYVTGYMAHRDGPGAVRVRSSDAHGWAEAYVQGVGWITVDATPTGWIKRQSLPELARDQVAEWVDSITRAIGRLPWNTIGAWFAVLGLATSAIHLLVTWWQGRPRPPVPWRYHKPDRPLERAARRFTQACRDLGLPFGATDTWQECALLLDPARAPYRSEILSFVAQYNALRFGRITVKGLARLEVTLRRLERLGRAVRSRRRPRG